MASSTTEEVYVTKPVNVRGYTFTVSTRYAFSAGKQRSKILGTGSFGVVCSAFDREQADKPVAIKQVSNYAEEEWEARHCLRELRILRHLAPHPNIITLYDQSVVEENNELYMIMELMDSDLNKVIRSSRRLTPAHIKCIMKQILEGLKAMHSISCFHRDLKPANILLTKDCCVRITDFGLARFMDDATLAGKNSTNPMTEYVVTRWYRAPELLLSENFPYNEKVDMWSLGCIFAELLNRKPLFPGSSHANQVMQIFEVMGYNPEIDFSFPISEDVAGFLKTHCQFPAQDLASILPDIETGAWALIQGSLEMSPDKRLSAKNALLSSYLTDAQLMYDYSKEYLSAPPASMFAFEKEELTVQQLKDMIRSDIENHSSVEAQSAIRAAINHQNLRSFGHSIDQGSVRHHATGSGTSSSVQHHQYHQHGIPASLDPSVTTGEAAPPQTAILADAAATTSTGTVTGTSDSKTVDLSPTAAAVALHEHAEEQAVHPDADHSETHHHVAAKASEEAKGQDPAHHPFNEQVVPERVKKHLKKSRFGGAVEETKKAKVNPFASATHSTSFDGSTNYSKGGHKAAIELACDAAAGTIDADGNFTPSTKAPPPSTIKMEVHVEATTKDGESTPVATHSTTHNNSIVRSSATVTVLDDISPGASPSKQTTVTVTASAPTSAMPSSNSPRKNSFRNNMLAAVDADKLDSNKQLD